MTSNAETSIKLCTRSDRSFKQEASSNISHAVRQGFRCFAKVYSDIYVRICAILGNKGRSCNAPNLSSHRSSYRYTLTFMTYACHIELSKPTLQNSKSPFAAFFMQAYSFVYVRMCAIQTLKYHPATTPISLHTMLHIR
jgi:hypothetical protein